MKKKFTVLLCLLLTLIPVSVWGMKEYVTDCGVLYECDGSSLEAIAIGRAGGTNEEILIGYAGDIEATRIKEYAFSEDPYLTTLYVFSTVTEIGQEAFWECPNLTTVTFEDGLRVIKILAFYYCMNLTSVTLPASVEEIEGGAFSGCDKLKIHYLGTKEQWEKIRGSKYIDISVVDFAISEESSKSANPLKVKGKTVKVKKQKNLPVSKIISFKNKGKGKLSYSISSVNRGGKRYFKINSKTGRLSIKKGLKKGTYKVKIKVTAAGNKKYKAGSKTATVIVRKK